jgi:hypothetical protein
MKVDAVQTFFKSAWDYSCYADCIIRLAAEINGNGITLGDVGRALDIGIDRKYIYFNEDDYSDRDNFWVKDPAGFLGALTGRRFLVEKVRGNYVCGKNEYEILFMTLSVENGKKNIGHFVLPDWDPVQDSNTRRNGFVWSKRIFREVER